MADLSVVACGENGRSTLCHAADVHGSRWSPVKRDGGESPLSMDEPDNAVTCNKSAANVQEHAQVEDAQVEKISLEFFEWPKMPLSKKEKEDDFAAITGSRLLPERPPKRSEHIEKSVHYLGPGMWLGELAKDRYEVRERKKPRGLKAIAHSVDSDSE